MLCLYALVYTWNSDNSWEATKRKLIGVTYMYSNWPHSSLSHTQQMKQGSHATSSDSFRNNLHSTKLVIISSFLTETKVGLYTEYIPSNPKLLESLDPKDLSVFSCLGWFCTLSEEASLSSQYLVCCWIELVIQALTQPINNVCQYIC